MAVCQMLAAGAAREGLTMARCRIYQHKRCNCDPEFVLAWSQPDAARN